jgi:hypothetical protein
MGTTAKDYAKAAIQLMKLEQNTHNLTKPSSKNMKKSKQKTQNYSKKTNNSMIRSQNEKRF